MSGKKASNYAERAVAVSVHALMKLPAEEREARVKEFERRVDHASRTRLMQTDLDPPKAFKIPKRVLWYKKMNNLRENPGKWGLIEQAPVEKKVKIYGRAVELRKLAAKEGRWDFVCQTIKEEGGAKVIIIAGRFIGDLLDEEGIREARRERIARLIQEEE